MEKAFKLVLLLVNALLSVYYIISSFYLWDELNFWYDWNMQSIWTPFYVYPYRIPNMDTVLTPVHAILNLPFMHYHNNKLRHVSSILFGNSEITKMGK